MSSIFDKIDALSEWSKDKGKLSESSKDKDKRLPKKFIADLQEILTALAFHATTTDETAAEDWHDDVSNKLATEFNSETKSNKSISARKKASGTSVGSDIPASLRSILNGTHQSFKS